MSVGVWQTEVQQVWSVNTRWRRYCAGGAVAAMAFAASACYNPMEPSDIIDKIVMLSSSASEIPADGFSTVRLKAEITKEAAEGRRNVTFATTRGTFVGSGESGGQRIARKATADGFARVELVSATRVGAARVTAEVYGGVVAEVVIRFVALDDAEVLGWSASRTRLPADGESRTTLTATVAAGVPGSQRKVVVRATAGELVGGTKVGGRSEIELAPDGRGVARAELTSSNTASAARVTAEIALRDAEGNERGVVRELIVYFEPVDSGEM